ncbi:DUF2971 domain-containing protein [Pseudoalteromonas sp. T1lg22]|uniref:DUF2971 domain-containing protein n=1 Tax=Pseudoalteromonas sp. T1lg22 TaxID=2077096 RepID=UPI00131A0896|nr:DUF2971 domain-containing protein [Pseudoalteromonas sp. T1lg22]
MFEFPRDSQNEYLFHYTSVDTLVDHILPKRQLLLSSFSKVNDPKEYKDFILQPCRRDADRHTETFSQLQNTIWPEFKRRLKVACFVSEQQKDSEELLNYSGRGFVNSPLWHHYASKGEGVCLVFNKSILLKAFEEQFPSKSYHGEIEYRAIPANKQTTLPWAQMNMDMIENIGLKEYVDWHIAENHKSMFFNKSPEWGYEKEYRLVVTSDKEGIFLNIDKCLAGLVFGPNANLRDRRRVLEIPDRRGFGSPMYKLNYKNCSPIIDHEWGK